jgi:hypothetical protein
MTMAEDSYEHNLVESIQSSTADELKTILAFFDSTRMRGRHPGLLRALREELRKRGFRVP